MILDPKAAEGPMLGRFRILTSRLLMLILLFLPGVFARNHKYKASSSDNMGQEAQRSESKAITVWKIGSPWNGDIPDSAVPPSLDLIARHMGYVLKIRSFPSRTFASAFFQAFESNQPPDILVLDNIGTLEGMSTPHGQFQGITSDPQIQDALEPVKGATLKALQERGMEYLIRTSPNYDAARTLALQTPQCTADSDPSVLPTVIRDAAVRAANAYLENSPLLKGYEDSDRLQTGMRQSGKRSAQSIRACGYWRIGNLAFVQTIADYGNGAEDNVDTLMVLRRYGGDWRLLTASADPISNGAFVSELPILASVITQPSRSPGPLQAPVLLTPNEKILTHPAGMRFADFSWHPSSSPGEAAEIVEFAESGNAYLFTIFFSGSPPETEHLSSAALPYTGRYWVWRVWSISDSGVVSFSSARSFEY